MSPRGKAPRGAPGIVDRARAALLGVAVGDALGATTEFMTPAQIRSRYGVLREIVGGVPRQPFGEPVRDRPEIPPF